MMMMMIKMIKMMMMMMMVMVRMMTRMMLSMGWPGVSFPAQPFLASPRLTASQWPLCIYRFPICNFVFVSFSLWISLIALLCPFTLKVGFPSEFSCPGLPDIKSMPRSIYGFPIFNSTLGGILYLPLFLIILPV